MVIKTDKKKTKQLQRVENKWLVLNEFTGNFHDKRDDAQIYLVFQSYD